MKTNFVEVEELFEKEFKEPGHHLVIPYYQRGYRWRTSEVKALLFDIKNEREGYCLQPIVLKNSTIVDGQQRLTTITLIREYLRYNDDVAKRDLKEIGRNAIDNHFIKKNEDAIKDFFSRLNRDDVANFKQKLNKCRFIVCRLDENENEEDVFMRLNAGKIPLSSAEILKSYYLTDNNQKNKCVDFLPKWLDMEKTLQDDAFFHFFSHDDKKESERYYSSRMDFLLEVYLIKEKLLVEKEFGKEYESSPIFAFTIIHDNDEKILDSDLINSLENIIKAMKLIYDDTELYNLYGFLSCSSAVVALLSLLSEVSGKDGNQILNILKKKAKEIVGEVDKESLKKSLEKLDYYNNKEAIKTVLLMHNAIRSTDHGIRFDYNAYHNDNYDLEHIHARAEIKGGKDLEDFRNEVIKEYKDKKHLKEFLEDFEGFDYEEGNQDKQAHLELWEECIWCLDCGGSVERSTESSIGWRYTLPEGVEKDFASEWRVTSIRNLCLLPASVNRSIGNRSFAIKRKRVTEEFLKGTQLPVVTAEIFSVFVSSDSYKTADAPVWGMDLGDKYLGDIVDKLEEYLR